MTRIVEIEAPRRARPSRRVDGRRGRWHDAAAMSDHVDTDHVPTDDWTVPKLIGIGFLVLGTFFMFIYNVSP